MAFIAQCYVVACFVRRSVDLAAGSWSNIYYKCFFASLLSVCIASTCQAMLAAVA